MNLRYALGGAALLSCVTTQAVENFIAGDVHATNGKAEAGVWVIAETDALPTPYRKIVVTDQHGKFVLPQLPAAKGACVPHSTSPHKGPLAKAAWKRRLAAWLKGRSHCGVLLTLA